MIKKSFLMVFVFSFVVCGPCWAYIEPGLGYLLTQIIAGGLAGSLVFAKSIKNFFRTLFTKKQ